MAMLQRIRLNSDDKFQELFYNMIMNQINLICMLADEPQEFTLPEITSPNQRPEVMLPILNPIKRFDFKKVERRQPKSHHKLMADIDAWAWKKKHLQNQQSLQKVKNRRTLNKTYKHVQPKYLEKLDEGKKTQLPVLNSLSLLIENDLESSKILNEYKIISHIGKGCFSVVSSAVNKNTHSKCAIKTYTRIDQMDDIKIKNIQSEVRNLMKLKHENIIELVHAVKNGRKIQLVLENGGKQSLAGLLRKVKNFDEETTKKYFKQIASAVAHCHQQNICHRDLKLQNILVDDKGKIKIIDFGFSTTTDSRSKLSTFCGTPPYMCPELASRQPYNGFCADIWALGISLYLMLYGKFPFRAADERELFRLIQQGKYKVDYDLSPQVRNLMEKMLKGDQSSRATAQQVLENEWVCI